MNFSSSVYIHIPFCNSKCSYCDFFSVTDHSMVEKIISRTMEQTTFFMDKFGIKSVPTVYIGGGTPTSIPLKTLTELLIFLGRLPLESDAEFTIEANPETVNQELISMLLDSPVNRLSLGIQSFDEKTLKTLGRHCTSEINHKALELIKKRWAGKLSIDFISSVPGQKIQDAISDLKTGIGYAPDHISMYSLTLEDGTLLGEKYNSDSPLIDENVWIKASDFLEESGYKRYEISNFAREGFHSRHNSRYWQLLPYIGAGPGGVSTLHQKKSLLRISNLHDLKKYLSSSNLFCGAETENIETRDFIFEYMMMGFRQISGIDEELFFKTFERKIVELIPKTIEKWQENSLLETNGTNIFLNKNGLLLLNQFLLQILEELDITF